MDQRKKSEENHLIEDILKEGEDLGDVDLAGLDVEAILKETDIDVNILSHELDTKDDVTTKELLSGINIDINKATNNDHLIQNIMKEINTEIISKKKETKKKLPKFDEFFSLINYLEKKNYKINEEDENESADKENIFLLKNYKLNSKKKIEVLKFPPKTTLSSRFFKGGNILTSITANEDVIFTGNNLGMVKVYSCEKEMEYKSFCLEQIQKEPQSKRAVTCMDV